MRRLSLTLGIIACLGCIFPLLAQNTITTGTWNDPTIWSTGSVPAAGGTVNVNHALELNANLTVNGTYNINQNLTDFPGGTEYTLTLGGTLNVAGGTTNFGGVTASIGGASTFLYVRSGATLILTGPTAFANGTTVLIEGGGTLIINGDFENNITGSGSFTIQGLVQINGNYSSNGNVDVLGSGDLVTTGTITTGGASGTVFGSPNNCSSGPCSGQNLCLGGGVNIISASQYICSGSTASGLTGDAIGSASYQWTSSTTSSTSGFSDIGGATGQNYNPGTPAQTTWYRRRVTVGSCTGTSSAVVITIIPGSSWRGTTSTDWHTASNWCGGAIPTATTDVIVPAGVPNLPSVSTGNGVARNVTINNGATLTIASGRTLSIAGNLVNNGTMSTTGSVAYNGSTAQTISGSGFNTYSTLIINNSSGAVPGVTFSNSAVNVNTQLTLTAGVVNLSTFNITVGNAASNIGTLSYTAGRFYNGNVTRWFNTTAVTLGNAAGLFPLGSSTDYRPIYFGHAGLTAGGTIRVNHSATVGATAVAFTDNATTIQARSNSFWGVATGNGIGTGTFSIRTEGTGFGTVSDVTHLRLTLVNSAAAGTPGTNAGSTTNPQVNRTGITTANLTNNFYWGSTNSALTSLPITLASFTGQSTPEGAYLRWSTSSEKDFRHFSLERSSNGFDFKEIATIAAKGDVDILTNYDYLDGSVRGGRFYYRLRSVDLDGTSEYSRSIVKVDLEGKASDLASVFPNPSREKKIVVRLHTDKAMLHLYDAFGKEVLKGELERGDQEFTPNHLHAGLYYATIVDGAVKQMIKIIIVE